MPEWSNGPDSKSGVGLVFTVGSNPTLSAICHLYLTDISMVFALGDFQCYPQCYHVRAEGRRLLDTGYRRPAQPLGW
jgi:hypothetical protein